MKHLINESYVRYVKTKNSRKLKIKEMFIHPNDMKYKKQIVTAFREYANRGESLEVGEVEKEFDEELVNADK